MNKFEELQNLKLELQQEISKEVKSKKCICCDKPITKHDIETNIHPLKQERGLWNDGVVGVISAGYGSSHDMDRFYFAICDDCITLKLSNGNLEDMGSIRNNLMLKGWNDNLI